jgi:release factor glutamine methyltransferase
MLSYNQAFYELKNRLQPLYDEREAVSIAHEIINHITGLDKTQRLIQKETVFTDVEQQQYEQMLNSLVRGVPLQYVTHIAWFMGREYYVNEHVLIPRPETEELVQWILGENSQFPIPNSQFHILDIGTGSGCIPISLKLALEYAEVTSCDISNDAIEVAKRNAKKLNATIDFLHLDFLDGSQHTKMGIYDVIVSNPPYIPAAEKERLHTNVKDHEPGLALFVPDDDSLVFYKAIALFGRQHLNSNGYIYCELDANHAMECKALFEAIGYKNVEIRKDIHGNWRMLKAN